jgi:hypothetical protein
MMHSDPEPIGKYDFSNAARPGLRPLSVAVAMLFAALVVILAAPAAYPDEARPWLCRDKPVFSSERPMVYEATASKGRKWRLFFMQLTPEGPHDGFGIVQSRSLARQGGTASGHLPAGRYFVVALYYGASGYWLCPATTRELADSQLGVVSRVRFGGSESGSQVTLTVKPDNTTAIPGK